jgi:CheY-like chemotaxis protein
VDVADDGPGVARERRDSIFQGDSLRPGGLGVGLRHARALARAAGGDVAIAGAGPSPMDSELEVGAMAAAAGGACFRVTWPRADALPRPPVSTARLGDLAGARVLVVEDDEAVSQLLEAALEARGAEVLLARSFVELAKRLAAAASDPGMPGIDAVLLDLSPIARDVSGAFALFRKLAPRALLVLVTGSADALPAIVDAAAVEVVRKPFEVREVLAVVASGLRARRTNVARSESGEEDA